ncbi:hypothetical protein GE061_010832 [Apolygus lucorum]|uniref:Uncharacterized protein n=1 Tax=Apolygus lucorum TaxID=248454 RepID=A0A6A4JY12_APOLU|nr:hypothetical protein GE061_010832 [Apolygus lucorum]
MQPNKISIVLLLTALAAFAGASTTFPDVTSFDVSTTELTTSSEDISTTETVDISVPTEGTTVESEDHTTTADELYTGTTTDGTDVSDTSGTTETSAVTEEEAVDSSTLVEEEARKEDVQEVAETTTITPERKPVHEPPFIKKYWPLLCFKTKCDRRISAPVIPKIDAPEVRTDLEESRSSGDFLRAIEAEMVGIITTTENSSEEDSDERKKEDNNKGQGSNESSEDKDNDDDDKDDDDD